MLIRTHRSKVPESLSFLHIGKTAGTEIKRLLRASEAEQAGVKFRPRKHNIGLADLDPSERYFFSVRNPISRFYSGFYSRKRKGQPRLFVDWTPDEAKAFAAFPHANTLAEHLFSSGESGRLALKAMLSISHVSQQQHSWFSRSGFFMDTRPPVAIIRQEHFEDDIAMLFTILEIPLPVIEASAVNSHANNYAESEPLSPAAEANLRRWYAQDFEFLRSLGIYKSLE